ncbi:MAG: dihydropteroate synthase [Pseudobdellovibrionaceae bacterium]
MKCFIGLGSSLGDQLQNLEKAAAILKSASDRQQIKTSFVYKTPALIPEGGPLDWNVPYLNAVIQIEWSGSAAELLNFLKSTESNLGRTKAPRWAPRVIDLDLLTYGDEVIQQETDHGVLNVPHKEILTRSFVADPFKDIAPKHRLHYGQGRYSEPMVIQSRHLKTHSPLVMAILNLTPDSFSDGGENILFSDFVSTVQKIDQAQVPIIDVGAESTRPGATPLTAQEEWARLATPLEYLVSHFRSRIFKPKISVDTRHAEVAEKALALGADWINDVSGLGDPQMLNVLKNCKNDFVLMHSLTVPADPKKVLSDSADPVLEIKNWLQQKLQLLDQHNIDPERFIFDPGIGFGKTAQQSIALLKRMHEFSYISQRLLVGASRKSFMKTWGIGQSKQDRDLASIGLSLELANKGVDILRVHDFCGHQVALQSRAQVLA